MKNSTNKKNGRNAIKAKLLEIKGCLEDKYSQSWRVEREMARAEKTLNEGKKYELKRAQWGGKWGNYYHLIALNSKGEYQFVKGFNPYKMLD